LPCHLLHKIVEVAGYKLLVSAFCLRTVRKQHSPPALACGFYGPHANAGWAVRRIYHQLSLPLCLPAPWMQQAGWRV